MHDVGCNQGRLNPRSLEATRRAAFAFWRFCRRPLVIVLVIWTVLWKVLTQ
jgi:hypothetical protein